MEILIAHLIGDYIIQNDWMAENKRFSWPVAIIHGVTYIIPFVLFSIIGWLPTTPLVLILILIQHIIQDRTSLVRWVMDITGSKNFRVDYSPWSIIVVDNTLHLSWMLLLYNTIN